MPTFSEPLLRSLFEQRQVSMAALKQTGLPLEETTYLTIGGGIGSFTWVDHLVIHSVDPANIVALGLAAKPYTRCQQLCRNSQIFDQDRLRSDSGGTPDNIWGWPGYALREIWRDLKHGRVWHAAKLAWQIFTEPVLCEPFTPKAGDVFASLDREARRIGWSKIWRYGQAQALRKTDDGRYVVAYLPAIALNRPCKLIVASYIHLAVGYPGPRVLPELQSYRQQNSNGQQNGGRHFVNAYEPHDHVYHSLGQTGGTVLLRGRGITASRIIQRLHQEYCHNPNINILHLMRQPISNGPQYQYAQRLTKNHFNQQPYNFPKSCFGGEFRFILERANDRERAELIGLWGGTTTAKRREWDQAIATGLNQGWYQIRFGCLARVETVNNKLAVVVQNDSVWSEESKLQVDFIIDAIGLEPTPERNPFLQDLLQSHRLPKNVMGQLKVTNNFEIAALRNTYGRIYASGIMTLGGSFAPVDSFVGLQYAAQQSIASLIEYGAPGIRQLGPIDSVVQWLRWAAGVKL